MNPNNSELFQMIRLKLLKVWYQFDQTIERVVQQTIDELEETYQQD